MKKLLIYIIISFISFSSNNAFAQPGFLDPTFGTGGLAVSQNIAGSYSSAIQSDGKVLVGGYYGAAITERFNKDGSSDESFGISGRATLNIGYATGNPTGIAQVENNNIILSCWYLPLSPSNYDILLVRLKENGSIDSSFGKNGKATMDIDKHDYSEAMAIQQDGKIIVVGELGKNEYDELRIFIARFNPDGSIDSSFGENGHVSKKFDRAVTCVSVALQTDSKIVVGGTSGLYFSRPAYMVLRFNLDGSIDNSFGENGITSYIFGEGQGSDDWANELHAIAVQPDGKIICGGSQGDYVDFSYDMGLVRFNSNGILDNSYGENGVVKINYPGYYSQINTLLMQPDGKLIAGATAQDNVVGADPMLLMRFLDNGLFDSDFAVNGMQVTTNNNFPIACKSGNLEQDGKIILAGYSNSRLLVARYNGDNVLAANFKEVKAAQNNEAITITWQTLNESGTKSFTVERSNNATDYAGINTVPAKGVASNYSYIDKNPLSGTSYYRIRENAANGTNTFSPVVKVVFNDNGIISLYPNPAKNTVTVKGLNKNTTATIRITDINGREISKQNCTQSSSATLNIKALAQGSYFVLVEQNGKVTKLRMIKE